MDISAILDLVLKGVGVISTLISAGKSAAPAIKAVTDLITGAQAGTLTADQLNQTEVTLDALIADFNQPIT